MSPVKGNLTANGFGLVTGFRLPIASRKKLRCMKIDYKLELQCHGLTAMILDNKVESWCKMELAPECSRPATGDGRRSALDTHRITGKGMAPLTAPLCSSKVDGVVEACLFVEDII
nr:hypothetical protein Iba_chr12aCG4880 [Ipomoea batatas]